MRRVRFLKEFRKYVDAFDTKTACAAHLGITPQYLGDLYRGRRGVSILMAKRMGFQRYIEYKRADIFLCRCGAPGVLKSENAGSHWVHCARDCDDGPHMIPSRDEASAIEAWNSVVAVD